MSWGVDVYLELREQLFIEPKELGAMPLPEEVAAAFCARADAVEAIVAHGAVPTEPTEMRTLADEVRAGTQRGRAVFRQEMLGLIEVKRGKRTPAGILQYLPADVLAPFTSEAVPDKGHHAARVLDDRADPAIRSR